MLLQAYLIPSTKYAITGLLDSFNYKMLLHSLMYSLPVLLELSVVLVVNCVVR